MKDAAQLAEELLKPKIERDGVNILGGEPFAQPDGLLALVRELRLAPVIERCYARCRPELR